MIAKREDERRPVQHVGAAIRLLGADGYERSRIQPYIGWIHDAMLASVAGEVGSPESVLDVGCGTGRLLRKVAERWPGAALTGVDPAEEMISVARRLAPSVSFHVAAAQAMPVADSSIALALSSISLHHWEQQLEGLREIARTLRPSGCLCLADIAIPAWAARLVRSRARSPAVIGRLVAEAGLELRERRSILARVIVVAVAVKPGPPPGRPS
jgi:ubiquinone/menaquinone biosynthesis C-methylase UbiE